MRYHFLISAILGLSVWFCQPLRAQKMPEESPSVMVRQDFSTSFIQLEYSRPSVRGRKIFGGLINYDELWRAGANMSTKLTFGEDIFFANHKLAQGAYVLYIIPSRQEWTIILNKGLHNWGLSGYAEKQDVLRVKVPVDTLPKLQETFEISVENISKTDCQIVISWEYYSLKIPIKAENEQRIENMVDKLSHSEHPPYLVLARYYLAKKENLDQALEYVKIELAKNPTAFNIEALKAEILAQLGRNTEALESAKLFLQESKGTAYEREYKLRYDKLIAKLNAKLPVSELQLK